MTQPIKGGMTISRERHVAVFAVIEASRASKVPTP